ncbi:hypothetical protein [Chryseobacterium pennipullorum]|uniref:Uncharacterized protein n=1 Tax=Chryseobacterium pennipullorum TaxID=2258963 RepID=A0A3D9ANI4_9FLAO|nr:hypothetical protein [Chryseobacterium pennipullorum]REC42682.1 hypothetical protein DRF67_20255 [Chryseobacterium pennipullorum]
MKTSIIKRIQTDPVMVAILLLSLLLFFFLIFNASGMFFGNNDTHLKYLNIYSREPLAVISFSQVMIFRMIGFVLGIAAVFYLISLCTVEAVGSERRYFFLEWAAFTSIVGLSLFGGLIRSVGNQQGAANIYFFTILLYLSLRLIEKKYGQVSKFILKEMYLLPVYFTLFYTMGLPGWAKLFGHAKVIEKYERMFAGSFVADLPGGTPFMIYFLGILELIIPILLIISLVKGEFKWGKAKPWFNMAMVITCLTFMMLCVGLTIIFNFAGAANLIFYFVLTFFILASARKENNCNS